jgi:hypothetical protein
MQTAGYFLINGLRSCDLMRAYNERIIAKS